MATYIHTHIKKKIQKSFLSIFIFCCFTKVFFFSFFGHFILCKKHSDKFVPLYMKILTVHGIQQCALYSLVSAWREVNVPFFVCVSIIKSYLVFRRKNVKAHSPEKPHYCTMKCTQFSFTHTVYCMPRRKADISTYVLDMY